MGIVDISNIPATAVKGLKAIKSISTTIGKSSINRLAKESILMFPIISSPDIPIEDQIIINRGFEKYFAAALTTYFSLKSVDLNKNEDVAAFIKRYHSNSDIPDNIKAASKFLFESATCIDDPMVTPDINTVLSCWNNVTEQVNTTSLNDIYKPYTNTLSILEDKIKTISAANEATSKLDSTLDRVASSSQNDKYLGNPADTVNKEGKTVKKAPSAPQKFNAVISNDKLTAMEPTIANIQFVVHGGEGDSKHFYQNVTLGFKAMSRIVKSDVMVVNMIEATKNSNIIFKFIKWTKGEYKFVKDFLFNFTEIKDNVISANRDKSFLSALKRRKAINNVTRFADNKVLPSTSIVMTSYEVARVAEATGIDLREAKNAKRVLDNYYLVSLAIYDTETRILSTLFDGDDEFVETTIDGLKNASAKNSNLVSMSDAMKIFGRI